MSCCSIRREFLIFFGIFTLLAFGMHGNELVERFSIAIDNPERFLHPLAYTAIVYLIFLVIRFIVRGILNIFIRKKERKN